jgi:hypothetical protein
MDRENSMQSLLPWSYSSRGEMSSRRFCHGLTFQKLFYEYRLRLTRTSTTVVCAMLQLGAMVRREPSCHTLVLQTSCYEYSYEHDLCE